MGEPGSRHELSSAGEYMACKRGTRRTETSKQPEEMKTTVIP